MDPEEPLSAAQCDHFRDQGYVVVPGLLSDEEIRAFLDHESQPIPPEMRSGLITHKVDPAWHRLATHPRITGVMRQLLQGPPMVVQTMFLNKPPGGGKGLSLHQDLYYIANDPNTLTACWLALADADRENGGLCVVPGSHQAGLIASHKNQNLEEHATWEADHTLRDRDGREWQIRIQAAEVDNLDPDQLVVLTVPRGAGVFFCSTLIHGSFANRSPNRPRPAFAIHYVRQGTWVFRTDIQDVMMI